MKTIGDEFAEWNPQLMLSRHPMWDAAEPAGQPCDHRRSLSQIFAIDQEYRAAYGDCPAADKLFEKLLQESEILKRPPTPELDKLLGE